MEYHHESFKVINWFTNSKHIAVTTMLSESGVSTISTDLPKIEASILTCKDKSISVAWIVLEWSFENTDEENKVITYGAEDKYRINPFEYDKEGICDIVGSSFCLFFKEFNERLESEKIKGSMHFIEDHEIIEIAEDIIQLLQNKGF